ncbi:MAG: MnmC family methyltransferase [Candidatus Woesearchaeota archaeon]
MKKIITPDGSVTFHNEQFDESYHSRSGAKEEAVKKFAEPCQIAELAKKGHIRMLDICFGLGYNTAAAIDTALEANSECKIEVIGLEIDPEILSAIGELDNSFLCFDIIKEAAKNKIYKNNNVSIQLILGDAIETIKQTSGEFNAIFLDPFSPKKCPQLWTKEFFEELYKRTINNGRLATYSCARIVRDNLRAVGYEIHDGPQLWRRGPSTIAIKHLNPN